MSTIFNDPKFKVFAEEAEIMLAQSAVVTSLNRISVVACCSNVSAFEGTKRILSGNADGKNEGSYLHFFKRVSCHLSKEAARLVFKVGGGLMFAWARSILPRGGLFAGHLEFAFFSWSIVLNWIRKNKHIVTSKPLGTFYRRKDGSVLREVSSQKYGAISS